MRRLCSITVVMFIVLLVTITGYHTAVYSIDNEQWGAGQVYLEIVGLERAIQVLDQSIEEQLQRIELLTGDFKGTEQLVELAEVELAESEARLEEKRRQFGSRVRSAYMKGGASYLELLLEADSFGDLIVQMAYLKRIMDRDSQLVVSLKEERALGEQKKEAVQAQYLTLQDIRDQLEYERSVLVAQRKDKEELLEGAIEKLAGWKLVYGVIIDNHFHARPQHGLSEASLIYEYEVEGRITRLLALFAVVPSKVGPIRSARTHSVMLARENNVHYIYASGTADVLSLITQWGLRHTNALYSSSSSIYRDSARSAPHNLYVNLSSFQKEASARELVIRPAYLDRDGTPADVISLEYNSSNRIQYRYVPSLRAYRRYLNGQIHRDATGKDIIVRNIIIQYAPHRLDARRRPTPNLIGSGKIDFYAQGQHFQGTWVKDSVAAPTRFYYLDGQEIEMVFGQTWVQIARDR